MVIVSYDQFADMAGWQFLPRTRYVMGETLFRRIQKSMAEANEGRDPVLTWSVANSYERRYSGQDANGRRIAIYRESAFGDAMIVTGLAHHIKTLFPDCQIDIHSVPQMLGVWVNNTDVNFLGVPLSFDAMRGSDYHILLEGMIENDSEPEQQNCYDALYDFCGLAHFHVPSEHKRPWLVWGPQDEAACKQWKDAKPWKYVLWHVTPSSAPRIYPPHLQEQAIAAIAEHIDVVLVGRQDNAPMPKVSHPRVHDWTQRTAQWRSLLPMIREASCVVAPDSSVLHATAAFPDVPLVGLWGPFHPNDRAKYYSNHHAIHAHETCPYAPCRMQRNEFPVHKCVSAKNHDGPSELWCCALKNIPFERIVEKVVSLI